MTIFFWRVGLRPDPFPLFPSCTWERFLIPAKFHFALTGSGKQSGSGRSLTLQGGNP